jgi:hypothetical protein
LNWLKLQQMVLFCNLVLSLAKFLILADVARFVVRNPQSHQHKRGWQYPMALPRYAAACLIAQRLRHGSTTADEDLMANFCSARQNTGDCHLLPYRAGILTLGPHPA